MPVKKRNIKQTTGAKQRNPIIKRLMELSIHVDNYIYKNIPIDVEEAEKYTLEISLYKTQSNGDVRVLQVIEKLDRCLKSVIEETTKKQSITAKEKVNNIDTVSEYSVNNEHYSNTKVDCDSRDKLCKLFENDNKTIEAIEIKNTKSHNLDNIKIVKSSVPLFTITKCIKTDELKIPQSPSIDIPVTRTKLLKKYNLKCNCKDTANNTSLIVEFRESDNVNASNFSNTTQQIMNEKHDSPLEIAQTRITKRNPRVIKNNQQAFLEAPKVFSNVNITREEVTQKLAPGISNSANENNAAKQNKGKRKAQKPVANKKKRCIPKKILSDENLTHKKGRKRKTTNNKHNISSSVVQSSISPSLLQNDNTNNPIPHKYKHTRVDIISDEVSIGATWDGNNEFRNLTNNSQGTLISKQFKCLNMCNEGIDNDLTWVQSIRFVRAIKTDEVDCKLDNIEETFWHDFSLPRDWNNFEFHY